MAKTIAIAGKGGTGKTTIAALLVQLLAAKACGPVLAVDADPNSNLAETLGIEVHETIGSIIDAVAAAPQKIPSGITKDRFIEYQVQTAVAESEGFDILVMGRPEGPGCYCYANNVLRNISSQLLGEYAYVVIDNEAGLEHLSRRTTRSVDILVVVSDPTPQGLRAARRIAELVKELKFKVARRFLLINRASGDIEGGQLRSIDLEYLGYIPEDPEVSALSLKGLPLRQLSDEAASRRALRTLGEQLWLN